jgi:hypothetical protein
MVAVFHRIGEPTEDKFTHSLKQILDYGGEVTFDGAYTSLYEHRQELAKLKPILFVQGGTVGKEGICTWEQIWQLEDLGFVLGWHGWSHDRLTELSEEQIRKELQSSFSTKLYAYPHGDYSELAISVIKDCGYEKAYSTTQGEKDNDFAIFREYL